MLITTPEELTQYVPNHVVEDVRSLAGFIDNSENDFLLDKVGRPLYRRLCMKYEDILEKEVLIPGEMVRFSPWRELIRLCQRCVAYDSLYRSADIIGVSINDAGMNVVSSGNYDAADKEQKEGYKLRCKTEAHRAIDRLLVQLEEWAELINDETEKWNEQDREEAEEIVSLWKKSRYYYLADGLFINTAKMFNEYVDIYENREKFVTLLPDIRYCQDIVLRTELGDGLTDALLQKAKDGTSNPSEKKAIHLIRQTLSLKVEERSPMFNRKDAKSEAIQSLKMLLDYMQQHSDEMPEEIKESPFYEPPSKQEEPIASEEDQSQGIIGLPQDYRPKQEVRWKNNRAGNKLFVTHAIR